MVCYDRWRSGIRCCLVIYFFFFQAEDGIRDLIVTGVQTCALPIFQRSPRIEGPLPERVSAVRSQRLFVELAGMPSRLISLLKRTAAFENPEFHKKQEIGRASCRERV